MQEFFFGKLEMRAALSNLVAIRYMWRPEFKNGVRNVLLMTITYFSKFLTETKLLQHKADNWSFKIFIDEFKYRRL